MLQNNIIKVSFHSLTHGALTTIPPIFIPESLRSSQPKTTCNKICTPFQKGEKRGKRHVRDRYILAAYHRLIVAYSTDNSLPDKETAYSITVRQK